LPDAEKSKRAFEAHSCETPLSFYEEHYTTIFAFVNTFRENLFFLAKAIDKTV